MYVSKWGPFKSLFLQCGIASYQTHLQLQDQPGARRMRPRTVRRYVQAKYIYIHTFTYMHSHCAYSYTHISTHTHPYLHIHMHTHRHSYIYMFIHTHMHFHIHTHTHKYWAGQKVCLVLSQNKIFFIFFEELCGTLYPLTEQSFLPNTIYSYLHTCIFITHMYTQKYINICT